MERNTKKKATSAAQQKEEEEDDLSETEFQDGDATEVKRRERQTQLRDYQGEEEEKEEAGLDEEEEEQEEDGSFHIQFSNLFKWTLCKFLRILYLNLIVFISHTYIVLPTRGDLMHHLL